MTAETDLLPLPWIERYAVVGDIAYPVSSDPDGDYVAHDDHTAAMQAYARACVSSATEALRLRLHRIETGLTEQIEFHVEQVEEAEARAERLAEALQEAREYVVSELAAERDKFAGYEHCSNIASIEADLAKIDAALEQETTNG